MMYTLVISKLASSPKEGTYDADIVKHKLFYKSLMTNAYGYSVAKNIFILSILKFILYSFDKKLFLNLHNQRKHQKICERSGIKRF